MIDLINVVVLAAKKRSKTLRFRLYRAISRGRLVHKVPPVLQVRKASRVFKVNKEFKAFKVSKVPSVLLARKGNKAPQARRVSLAW